MKIDAEGNRIWMSILPIPSRSSKIYKILDNENGTLTFCGSSNRTDVDFSTDAVYGITNIETGELQ